MTALALCLLLLTQDSELVKEFESRLAKLDDNDIAGCVRLGTWAASQGLIDRAEEAFERVLKLDPNHAVAREKLGFRQENGTWVETPERRTRLKYKRAVSEGLQLPSKEILEAAAAKDRFYKRAIEFVRWKEHWIRALRTMDEATGLFQGNFKIRVTFEATEVGELARGFGQNGTGGVRIDLDKLAGYLKRVEEFEKAKKQGGVKVLLPPLKLESILTHELTHCFQNHLMTPWVAEGMACFATGDPYFYYYYNYLCSKVSPVEQTTTEKNLHYSRGMAFFDYFRHTFGVEKVKEFIRRLVDKTELKEAAEKVSGKSWQELSRDEVKWTEKGLQKYRLD